MLTQMKWKGTVSHEGTRTIAPRFRTAKTIQAMSSRCSRNGHSSRRLRSGDGDAISLAPDGDDDARAQLGPDPPHAHVDDVRVGLEVVPPDGGQEPLLGHHPASGPEQ